MMQNHKDEFTQFIWKRRMQTKRDVRHLFQQSTGMLGRLGDLISESSLESIQQFEKNNWAKLCKDVIEANTCELEDIPGYFGQKVLLKPPIHLDELKMSTNRTDFYLGSEEAEIDPQKWYCVYASQGPWTSKQYAKPMYKEFVMQTLEQVKQISKEGEFSYIHCISRLLDLIHPSHQLPANILAYPLYSAMILKRRLIQLQYDLGSQNDEQASNFVLDHKLALDILRQIERRLDKDLRAYFEFLVPSKAIWRVGLAVATRCISYVHDFYPGKDDASFGFDPLGNCIVNDTQTMYLESMQHSASTNNTKTIGIMVNMHAGNIHLVVDGKLQACGFGRDAMHFEEQERERQKNLIIKNLLLPCFAVQKGVGVNPEEQPMMKVNFGEKPFTHTINASPLNQTIVHSVSKGLDTIAVMEGGTGKQYREKMAQEEDEKLHTSLEKSYFKVSLLPDVLKSFSQFPPSVYRRSLAATRIQRAWRKFRGRKMRNAIRKEQFEAAIKIQRMARKKLRKIREVKNISAAKIQKTWRRKMLIWVALLRCIYQQPISELHRAAAIIQKKWRNWHMFKNSPLAAKYYRKVEELDAAATKIAKWWRALSKKLSEQREGRDRLDGAVKIQALWRGYMLRKQLKPSLRMKLGDLGLLMLKARETLFRMQAAYKIQRWFRQNMERKILLQKARTRNMAATRLQALWRGFWVRSHTALRFTYGEAIFLTAVYKALKQAHFILKMYRPCGIVCPKPEKKTSR
ncbi:hypothetical protein EDD86DRAFT_186711 [Gorgonomyces haynaldii]|nr:hypothetical protein EDD86DRAFT_186711 [Gorgonomyces haynaldii]